MNITKRNIFGAAVGFSAAVFTLGAHAVAYDNSSLDVPTGNVPEEFHVIYSVDEGTECNATCQSIGGEGAEYTAIFSISNQSACVQGATGCTSPNPVVDNTTGSAGANTGGSTGAVPRFVALGGWFPECAAGDPTCNYYGDLAPLTTFEAWDVTSAPNGKITGGWLLAESTIPGAGLQPAYVDFDNNVIVNFLGDTAANIDIACIQTELAGGNADPSPTCATGSQIPYGTVSFTYITLDAAQAPSGKAVPVPALAAAALGLGLVGITLLTSRRKIS